jgi:hypothetical protein
LKQLTLSTPIRTPRSIGTTYRRWLPHPNIDSLLRRPIRLTHRNVYIEIRRLGPKVRELTGDTGPALASDIEHEV